MTSRKGEMPRGLLTTTRYLEADGPLCQSEMIEKLVRALAREFAAAEIVSEAGGTPWIRCRLPRNWLAPMELCGSVRIRTHGNKAELMYEARLCAARGRWWPVLFGVMVWPLGAMVLRARSQQRAYSFDTLERAMERLYLHYRVAGS